MPLDCIIYDLDGTIIDSAPDIAIAVNRVRSHFGLDNLDEFDIRTFIGDGAKKLVERAIFGMVDDPIMRPEKRLPRSAADLDEVVSQFQDVYGEDPVIETTVNKGVTKVLRHWQNQGVAQVCLTNKPHHLALQVLEQLELISFFDLVVGPGALDDDGKLLPRKPDPTVLDFVLDQTGARREETIIIGDGMPDFHVAKAGQILCVGLICGYTDVEKVMAEFEDPQMVAASFIEAGEILERLNQSI